MDRVIFIRKYVAGVIMALAAAGGAGPSLAHGVSIGGSTAGLPIPSLSHGEMAIIAPHQGEIMGLARSALDTNEPFRRMLNFAQLQYAFCLWGIMPGSVADEASPFNECSHAYLAATKSLLLTMRTMPQEAEKANELASRIDEEMVLNSMSLIQCQFSGETFNTANVISPLWSDVPHHLPSMVAFFGAAAMASGLGYGGLHLLRKPQKRHP